MASQLLKNASEEATNEPEKQTDVSLRDDILSLRNEFRSTLSELKQIIPGRDTIQMYVRESVRELMDQDQDCDQMSTAASDNLERDDDVQIRSPVIDTGKTVSTGGTYSSRGIGPLHHQQGAGPSFLSLGTGSQDTPAPTDGTDAAISTGENIDTDISNIINRNKEAGTSASAKIIAELGEVSDSQKGPKIDEGLAKVIKKAYLTSSADTSQLNAVMKAHQMPENLDIGVPKMNPEVLLMQRFTNNEDFVQYNEKAFYSLHNYQSKAIAIMAKIADHTINVMDNKVEADPASILKDCVSAVTILGHLSADTEQKRKNNVRKILAKEYEPLCGPKSSKASKPSNSGAKFLLGDDLKTASKEAKRSSDLQKRGRDYDSKGSSSQTRYTSSQRQRETSPFRRGQNSNKRFRGQSRWPRSSSSGSYQPSSKKAKGPPFQSSKDHRGK